ncbi:putative ribonuclease H protein [Vitis vinifera]|uniref:Putative ribonuclease H protein n=1 Tax=Vitis vinifera TaxID=29760 RepID=A0A438EIB2_VITVI|nr:putative ribonuclease H protein [Vitis vinifera]
MQESPVCKRLDRFLYSNEWELSFPQSLQEVLPKWTSDHWPIVLDTNPFKWGPTPFRLRICGCNIIVSKSALIVGGENLKEMVGKERKKTILDEIAIIDANEQEGALSSDLAVQRAEFHQIIENERGLVLDNSESITEEILLYFKKLYSSPPDESWRVEGIDWSPISEESVSRLDSPFSEVEIYNAIFQLDKDKAPGPDGFTIAVFQDCWDVIKDDLVRVFAEFHNSGIINQNTNASFIVLLPKKSQSKKISDFRPISLITCLYKTNLDAVLIANEIVDEKKRSGEEGVGFSPKWRKWMRGCLSSVSYAILVNGNAKGWVKASRGLRQGDPLSHFLFTIVANVLSRMLLKAKEEVCWRASGLKVNLDKSNLFGINLDQNHLSRLALLFDCKASDWPILYLGLPLGGNPTACEFWDPVIERISKRLDGWQKAYLSFDGRITLLHSCLSHTPSYFLSLFKIPASVTAKVERMQRNFLWSGVGEGKRDHLISWDVVCKPRVKGGLGIGKIPLRNRALLGKWLWRYPRESTTLWHQNFNFRRNLTDYEIEDLERLMRSIDCMNLSTSASDARSWSLLSSGLFTVKSFSTALSQTSDSSPLIPSKFVWKSQVPFKVKAFVWLVAHKKVNTNDLLQLRRPHKALSLDICKLCMGQGESADHLFLHCSVTLGLWHRLFHLAKMDWVPPKSISDMMFINYKGPVSLHVPCMGLHLREDVRGSGATLEGGCSIPARGEHPPSSAVSYPNMERHIDL